MHVQSKLKNKVLKEKSNQVQNLLQSLIYAKREYSAPKCVQIKNFTKKIVSNQSANTKLKEDQNSNLKQKSSIKRPISSQLNKVQQSPNRKQIKIQPILESINEDLDEINNQINNIDLKRNRNKSQSNMNTAQDNYSNNNLLLAVKEECLEESRIVNNESFDINWDENLISDQKFYLSQQSLKMCFSNHYIPDWVQSSEKNKIKNLKQSVLVKLHQSKKNIYGLRNQQSLPQIQKRFMKLKQTLKVASKWDNIRPNIHNIIFSKSNKKQENINEQLRSKINNKIKPQQQKNRSQSYQKARQKPYTGNPSRLSKQLINLKPFKKLI